VLIYWHNCTPKYIGKIMSDNTELNDAIRELIEVLRSTSGSTPGLNEATQSVARNFKGLSGESTALTVLIKKEREEKERQLKIEADLQNAQTKAVDSFKKLGSAFINGEAGFAKFGSSMSAAGDAIWDATKNFGPLGIAVGAAAKAATALAAASLEQTDALLKASDAISKMGAVNKFSTETLYNFAHGASLTSKEIDKLIKPMQNMQGGLTRLGSTASDGVEKFAKMVNVSADVRNEFQRMGMNNEERIQAQADFITQMERTGVVLSGRLKTERGLQEASLEYTRNLIVLAELSGQDKKTLEARNEEAKNNISYLIQEREWKKKEQAATTQVDKDRIEAEKKATQALIADIARSGPNGPKIAAELMMQKMTGKVSLTLGQLGVDGQKYLDQVKEGKYVVGSFNDAYQKATDTAIDQRGTALILNDDYAKSLGLTTDQVKELNKFLGVNQTEEAKAAQARIEANKLNKDGAVVEDTAQKVRNALTRAEELAKLKVDDLVKAFNPLLGDLTMLKVATVGLTVAAGAAAVALASIAGKAGLEKLGGGTAGGGLPAGKGGKIIGGAAKGLGALGALTTGYEVGTNIVNPALNWIAEKTTGVEGATLGTALYDMMNPSKGPSATESTPLPTPKAKSSTSPTESTAGGTVIGSLPSGSVQGLLDFIASKESMGDYNILVGGKRANLTNMTVQEVLQLQNQMKRGGFESTAVGKYQIIQSTLLGNMQKAGVALTDKFDQSTQDKLGLALLKGRGLEQYLAKKISPEKFADQISMEWAAMPYHTGASYYDKVGSNKSLVSRQAFVSALPQAREGGIFSGSNMGFPVELHGNELVAPLDPNSILAKMLTASPSEAAAMMPNTGSSGVSDEMISAMINKFDMMINYLSEGVDIQQKILRQS
jgi:muramidase (phage lysozyme)